MSAVAKTFRVNLPVKTSPPVLLWASDGAIAGWFIENNTGVDVRLAMGQEEGFTTILDDNNSVVLPAGSSMNDNNAGDVYTGSMFAIANDPVLTNTIDCGIFYLK